MRGTQKKENGCELASSSVVLIRENGFNIIIDPGMNRKMLLTALSQENLKIEGISHIILTHTHLDHSLLAGVFYNAVIFDNTDIYSFDGSIKGHQGFIPETGIQIIQTPGHDQFHCSVLADTKDLGKVIVAGDVFWRRDGDEQEADRESLMDHKDPYVKDERALEESRRKILDLADWVIPGHGGMFKTRP